MALVECTKCVLKLSYGKISKSSPNGLIVKGVTKLKFLSEHNFCKHFTLPTDSRHSLRVSLSCAKR